MLDQTTLQMYSLITENAQLEVGLASKPIPEPKDDEVLIQVQAAPINPSDLGLIFGLADMSKAEQAGTADAPIIKAPVPTKLMRLAKARIGKALPVGNEGAGKVVKAGSSKEAQALMGRIVSTIGGGTYAQYRIAKIQDLLILEEGTSAREGASSLINPLTALSMTEAMKREGHKALVHTAAASNLGQMLNRICIKDGINLVNIVRKQEQVELLKQLGAKYICNSSSETFMEDLTQALVETGATIAFDATGGGDLASRILSCMETAANLTATTYSRYGSETLKQVYIYGGLDLSPTVLTRSFGFSWSVGGFLLLPYLKKIGQEATDKLKARVAREIKTTFASTYTKEISLKEALSMKSLAIYSKQATGEKFLINPTLTK